MTELDDWVLITWIGFVLAGFSALGVWGGMERIEKRVGSNQIIEIDGKGYFCEEVRPEATRRERSYSSQSGY